MPRPRYAGRPHVHPLQLAGVRVERLEPAAADRPAADHDGQVVDVGVHDCDLPVQPAVRVTQLTLLGDDERGDLRIGGGTGLDQHARTLDRPDFAQVSRHRPGNGYSASASAAGAASTSSSGRTRRALRAASRSDADGRFDFSSSRTSVPRLPGTKSTPA